MLRGSHGPSCGLVRVLGVWDVRLLSVHLPQGTSVCASCASCVGGVGLGLLRASTPGCSLAPGPSRLQAGRCLVLLCCCSVVRMLCRPSLCQI